MPLDDEAKKSLFSFLQKRAPTPGPCTLCGNQQWTLGENIWELREYKGGDLVVGGVLLPVIPVFCSNCGNTLFINAKISGAMGKKTKEDGANEPK